MKLNTYQCHLLVFNTKYEHSWVKVGNDKIWEGNKVKLRGIATDNTLKFEGRIFHIFLKANQKVSVLSRLVSLLNFDRKRILFFISQLSIVL